MTDGAMLTEILTQLEIPCDKYSFHGKLDALAAGLGIDTEGRLLGDVLDDIAAKEGIQRDNHLYGAFIRKLYDYVTNGEDVTLTGNPLVLANSVGRPLKECVVSWEPTQEGEGTPYPAGGGPNLLDISQCTPTVGKPYGLTLTIDGDIIKASGIPSSEVTEEGQYSFAVASCAQAELRGKGYKVTPFAIKGKIFNAWGLRTEDESSLAISAKLTPGVDTDIQFRLMVSKDEPAAYALYANIRPIHGRDSVQVERCGENLLPFGEHIENIYVQQIMASDALLILSKACAEQELTLTFTLETQNLVFKDTAEEWQKRIGFECHGTLADGTEVYTLQCWLSDSGGELTKNGKKTKTVTVTMPKLVNGNIMFYAQNIMSGSFVAYDFGIYAGTTVPTTYTPYIGQTNTLTLPSTVYGGEVDAVTGAGAAKIKVITVDGERIKFSGKGDYWNLPMHSAEGIENTGSIIVCSHFAKDKLVVNMPYSFIFTIPDKMTDLFASADELSAYCAAQHAAGTPVQIAYKLATPVPFQATGGGAIPTVKGTNTLLTDADTIKATYSCNVRAAEQEINALYTNLLNEVEK